MQVVHGFFCGLLWLYTVGVFARVLLSWFPFSPDGVMATMTGFVYMVTDFMVMPLRRKLPPLRLGSMMVDLSATIVIFALMLVMRLLGC